MIFSSIEFIFVFLPLAFGTFLLLSRLGWVRAAMIATILYSLVFYAWWNPPYVLLIIALILVNYGLGKYLLARARFRKAVLTAGVGLNLGVLGYFKYTDFFISNADRFLGLALPLQHVILPLAISFFIFQKIAFLVDVYQGKITRLAFLDYCLFVVFFPQLIAGPIVHYRQLSPQFDRLKAFGPSAENIPPGLAYFLIGLAKKVIIADSISHYVSPTFAAAAHGFAVPAGAAWLAALAYTCQLYFDFSGYSDMAIGLARMFSIRLPVNFNSPYKAQSIIDFWRRWHMTLSAFLRDYLYIPLGGNRHGASRRYLNLMATMLLGGLWHGADWTFVAWGGLHGLYLVVNHLWRDHVPLAKRLNQGAAGPYYQAASHLLTFLAVVFAWVFFRATSFSAAGIMIAGMVGANGGQAVSADLISKFAIVGGLCILAMTAPNSQEIVDGDGLKVSRGLVYAGLGAAGYVAVMLLHAPTEFIYFRF